MVLVEKLQDVLLGLSGICGEQVDQEPGEGQLLHDALKQLQTVTIPGVGDQQPDLVGLFWGALRCPEGPVLRRRDKRALALNAVDVPV